LLLKSALKSCADIVVLEKDLRTVHVEAIKDVKIEATMMNGKFTHRDGL